MIGEKREGSPRPFLRAGGVFILGLVLLMAVGMGIRLLGETPVSVGDPSAGPDVAVLGVDSPWSGDEQIPPAEEREPSFAEGEVAYASGRALDAFELFSQYVERHPESVRGHYMVGLSALKAGLREEAELGFRATLNRDSGHVSARLNLARMALDAGRPGDALDLVAEVVRQEPLDAEAQRVLGRVHHNLGYFNEAVAAYTKAIALDPRDVWSMNNIGYLYIEQGRFEEALPPLARAVELSREPRFQNNLGVALERLGYYQGAASAFRAALAAKPEDEKAAINLARVDRRQDAPGMLPLDLAMLATQFASETLALAAGGPGVVSVPSVSAPPEPVEP